MQVGLGSRGATPGGYRRIWGPVAIGCRQARGPTVLLLPGTSGPVTPRLQGKGEPGACGEVAAGCRGTCGAMAAGCRQALSQQPREGILAAKKTCVLSSGAPNSREIIVFFLLEAIK